MSNETEEVEKEEEKEEEEGEKNVEWFGGRGEGGGRREGDG